MTMITGVVMRGSFAGWVALIQVVTCVSACFLGLRAAHFMPYMPDVA